MNIIRTDSESEFDSLAADLILCQMRTKPDSVIGLSTGRTTHNMHRIVCECFKSDPFDISGITFFAIDEITGVPETNLWACKAKLKREIIDELGIAEGQFVTLPVNPDKIEDIASEFYALIKDRGGIDLIILGLGENGHLGFNQPGTPTYSRIRLSTMDSDLELRIKDDCGFDDSTRLGGITIGIADIMEARKLILAVKGSNKAEILPKVIKGPITESVPASILQTHPNCTVLVDAEAMGKM